MRKIKLVIGTVAVAASVVFSYAECWKSTDTPFQCAEAGENVNVTLYLAPSCGSTATCPSGGCSCATYGYSPGLTTTQTGKIRIQRKCTCTCTYVCDGITYGDGKCRTGTDVYDLGFNNCPS